MNRHAGLWISRIAHRLEEKVPRSTWASSLPGRKAHHKNDEKDKKAGSVPLIIEASPSVPVVEKKRLYPSGKPLRSDGREMSMQYRPKSTSDGEYLFWGFSPHAGFQSASGQCPKGKHELMSANGLHGSIPTQLARRGGGIKAADVSNQKKRMDICMRYVTAC